jgi:hypothetical protein
MVSIFPLVPLLDTSVLQPTVTLPMIRKSKWPISCRAANHNNRPRIGNPNNSSQALPGVTISIGPNGKAPTILSDKRSKSA